MNDADIYRALIGAADKLKQLAPHEWGSFLQALSATAEIDNQRLLAAEAGGILHAQGRAVAMQQLCITLNDASAKLKELQHRDLQAQRRPRTP